LKTKLKTSTKGTITSKAEAIDFKDSILSFPYFPKTSGAVLLELTEYRELPSHYHHMLWR
jgi:hypothetical protein